MLVKLRYDIDEDLRNKKIYYPKHWEQIVEKLNLTTPRKMNYVQAESKWNRLKSHWRKARKLNQAAGVKRYSCEYQDVFDELYGGKILDYYMGIAEPPPDAKNATSLKLDNTVDPQRELVKMSQKDTEDIRVNHLNRTRYYLQQKDEMHQQRLNIFSQFVNTLKKSKK